ncbi:hypothetical protein RND81_13G134500 [Saponaria officinalis]|uniref:Uncharacterized protein n=1 Tax=Saponaria officinalis TaxID=3572 RepID=A0AAW1GXC9_SAPOF
MCNINCEIVFGDLSIAVYKGKAVYHTYILEFRKSKYFGFRRMPKLRPTSVASVLVMFCLLIICAPELCLSANVGLHDVSWTLANEARDPPRKVVKRSLKGRDAQYPPSPFHNRGISPICC